MRTLLILLLIIPLFAISQNTQTLDYSKVCEISKDEFDYVKPVDFFKDSLEVSIMINSFEIDGKLKSSDFMVQEIITNESKIYKIDKNIAISVSVGRVHENNLQYYIYKTHLFRKIKGCWEEVSSSSSWNRFSLGYITSGMGFGRQGTSTYIGFSGKIEIN